MVAVVDVEAELTRVVDALCAVDPLRLGHGETLGRPAPRGRVKDVGVPTRLFTGVTRRAVQVRDKECSHPYCDVAAEHCEIDHVRPWSEGGPTVESNGRLACGFHNRERHRPRPPP